MSKYKPQKTLKPNKIEKKCKKWINYTFCMMKYIGCRWFYTNILAFYVGEFVQNCFVLGGFYITFTPLYNSFLYK